MVVVAVRNVKMTMMGVPKFTPVRSDESSGRRPGIVLYNGRDKKKSWAKLSPSSTGTLAKYVNTYSYMDLKTINLVRDPPGVLTYECREVVGAARSVIYNLHECIIGIDVEHFLDLPFQSRPHSFLSGQHGKHTHLIDNKSIPRRV